MKYVLLEGWVFSKYLKKNRGRFPKQVLQYFLEAALRHSSEMIQALYFSHLSISCLGNKQENLKKCLTGIALSSGEDPYQECGWMCMRRSHGTWQVLKAFVPRLLNVHIPIHSLCLCLFGTLKSYAFWSRIWSQTQKIIQYTVHLLTTQNSWRFRSVCSRTPCCLKQQQSSGPLHSQQSPCTQPDMHTTPWGSSHQLSSLIVAQPVLSEAKESEC